MNVKNLKDYVMNKVADGIASRKNRSLAQIVENLKDSLKKSINSEPKQEGRNDSFEREDDEAEI